MIRQLANHLDQTFAVGSCPHYDGAVEVLQRACHYLGSRSRAAIHQNDKRHQAVHRFRCRVVLAICARHLAFRIDHFLAFRQEEVSDVDSLVDCSARVASQIKNKALGSLAAHFIQCFSHLSASPFRKASQIDVAGLSVGKHSCIRHLRKLYRLARDEERLLLFASPHFQFECCACLASKHRTDLGREHALHVFAVDGKNDVTCLNTCQLAGRPFVRLADDCPLFFLMIANDAANAGIFTRCHLAKVLIVFGIIVGERVHLLQHRADAPPYHGICVERIDVEEVELLVDVIEKFEVTAYGRIGVLFLLRCQSERQHTHYYIYIGAFHFHYLSVLTS